MLLGRCQLFEASNFASIGKLAPFIGRKSTHGSFFRLGRRWLLIRDTMCLLNFGELARKAVVVTDILER